MLERKIDRQRASCRDAHQISALDAQKLHQCGEILAIRIQLPWRNQPRIAKASLIITDDPVVLGEDSELLVPRSSIQQVSMDEYEGMAARVPLSCAIQIAKATENLVCIAPPKSYPTARKPLRSSGKKK